MNALITGGSSGIGLAVAHRLAKEGINIFLISRNQAKLELAKEAVSSKHEVNVSVHSCDVTNYNKIAYLINEIDQKFPLDYIICSAGQITCGKIDETNILDFRKTMDVNYFGTLYTCMVGMSVMKKRYKGHLGIIGSVAGYFGAIGYGGYSPTKFALTGLAECIRMEAADYGIQATIIYPPDTDTPLLEWEKKHTMDECLALSKKAKVISPNLVADKLYKAMQKNQFEVYCNYQSKIIRSIRVLIPSIYFNWLDRVVRKDREKRKVL